jgi:transcription factor TGA
MCCEGYSPVLPSCLSWSMCPGPGAAMFDMEYARWLEDHGRLMAELHGPLQDSELRAIVDDTLTHHDALFHLKAIAAKSDVFHLITGVWVSPAERCYLWMGGFRPSDLLKVRNCRCRILNETSEIGLPALYIHNPIIQI